MNEFNYSPDFFLALTYRFEQENGNQIDPFSQILIDREIPKDLTLIEIQAQLIRDINDGQLVEEALLGMAVWAIGKSFDPKLKPFFTNQLRRALDSGANHTLYQAMIALDNLNEPIFAADSGSSAENIELNRRYAHEYLAQLKT